jgi:repressor LexA
MPDTIFENEFIRQGILFRNECDRSLPSDQTHRGSGVRVEDILREIMAATGWKQARLAQAVHTYQGNISKWLSGIHSPNKDQWDQVLSLIRKDPRLEHLRFETSPTAVPLMGRVGAGAIIEPDFDQIPPEGLSEVSLPFPVPDGMIAFEVDGDSMYPRYDPGDIIVVRREQNRPPESFIGQFAAVRTADGRRYLKRIYAGTKKDSYRLESFNAPPIHDVTLVWIGEIHATVPQGHAFESSKVDRPVRSTKHVGRAK